MSKPVFQRNQIGETLYNLDSKGKLRKWEIFVEDHGDCAQIVMVTGLDGGKMIENVSTVEGGKNAGKANETSYLSQAESEANSKYIKQLKQGYVSDKTKVKQAVTGSGVPKPMLAQKYDPTGKQDSSKTLDQMKIRGKKVGLQTKFDGLRGLAHVTPDVVEFWSRKGEKFQPIPHLERQLRKAYDRVGLYDDIWLDGELFTQKYSFNKLSGLLKKETKNLEELIMLEDVYYCLYDVMLSYGYEHRSEYIKQFSTQDVRVVPTFIVDAEETVIEEHLERFLDEGHEGLMMRALDVPYENKRTWQLTKRKVFEDSEFTIVDFEISAAGFLGAVVCKMDTEAFDRDGKPITVVKGGVKKLSQEEQLEMLRNKDKYIGKTATLCYFGRSEYKVPRFPKFKGIATDR